MTDSRHRGSLHYAVCPACGKPRIVRWLTGARKLVYRRHGCPTDNQPVAKGAHVTPV